MMNVDKMTVEEFKTFENEKKISFINKLYEVNDFKRIIYFLTSLKVETLTSDLLSMLAVAYNNEDMCLDGMRILDRIPENDRDGKWYYRYGYSCLNNTYPVKEEDIDKALNMFNEVCKISLNNEVKDWCLELITAFSLTNQMFFKRKELNKLYEYYLNSDLGARKESPLEYWEDYSYMLALTSEDYVINDETLERIEAIEGIEVKYNNYLNDNIGELVVSYNNLDFKVGYLFRDFYVDEVTQGQMQYFTNIEKENIINTKKELTVFMKFLGDPKKAYHLQLKLIYAMVPDMYALYDESAEKLLNSKWVELAAKSSVVPGPENMYVVQAVSDDDKIWLHTHGLCRCNLHELEILGSTKDDYETYHALLSNYACRLLDEYEEFVENEMGEDEIFGLGVFHDGQPIVATSKPWVEGLSYYPKDILGGFEDRIISHNSKTNLIFMYRSEEDMNADCISMVGEFTEKFIENPMFYLSNNETKRMSSLAQERFFYVSRVLEEKQRGANLGVLVKVGLATIDNEGNLDYENKEHIWFEAISLEVEGFKAKLTQEPYHIPNLHEGDEGIYRVVDVSDWIIYTNNGQVTPETVYLLDLYEKFDSNFVS